MNKPDKAQVDDFGEDFDIPAYDPTLAAQSASDSKESNSGGGATESMYERTGRVAPQVIPPRDAEESEEGQSERAAEAAGMHTDTAAVDSTDTVVFDRPTSSHGEPQAERTEDGKARQERVTASADDRNVPLASDAPTTARDTASRDRAAEELDAARSSSRRDTTAGHPTTSRERRRPPRTRPAPEPTMVMSREPSAGTDYAATASRTTPVSSDPLASEDFSADTDYAAPAGADAAPVAAAAYADPALATDANTTEYDPARDHRRGTMDLGIFLLRIVVGAYLTMEGVKTFFQLGNSGGLAGLESDFAGYSSPWLLSVAQPSLQLLAGVFLLLGLLSPVAAAVGIAVTTLSAMHQLDLADTGLNVLAWTPEVIVSVLLMVAVISLQFTGPGTISLDYNRSWAHRPLASSWVWVVIGLAAAVGLWWFAAGVNPLT